MIWCKLASFLCIFSVRKWKSFSNYLMSLNKFLFCIRIPLCWDIPDEDVPLWKPNDSDSHCLLTNVFFTFSSLSEENWCVRRSYYYMHWSLILKDNLQPSVQDNMPRWYNLVRSETPWWCWKLRVQPEVTFLSL